MKSKFQKVQGAVLYYSSPKYLITKLNFKSYEDLNFSTPTMGILTI